MKQWCGDRLAEARHPPDYKAEAAARDADGFPLAGASG
jgi:hypothetical protein